MGAHTKLGRRRVLAVVLLCKVSPELQIDIRVIQHKAVADILAVGNFVFGEVQNIFNQF